MSTYYKSERKCEECGAQFWGTAGANFCSAACRSRNWRALRSRERWQGLAALCTEVVQRQRVATSPSKVLIRLLRVVASILRSRGWDPVELLAGSPEDPITGKDDSPGGIEGTAPQRVKRLHSPVLELELIEEALFERGVTSANSREWHEERRAELLQQLTGLEPPKPGSED
jgi:hypothetical protein